MTDPTPTRARLAPPRSLRRLSTGLPTLLLAAAAPSWVHAEAAPARLPAVTVTAPATPGTTEGTGAYTAASMSTATGMPLSTRETPQSISVVTSQAIEDQGLKTTGDVLATAPGISVFRNDGNRLTFSARGFTISNYQFDGLTMPVLSPWSFGESNLDTAIYDRVEIVRGATGLMTGAGEPSAAINFVRKRALRDFAASASLAAGRWNRRRATADVSTPITQDGRVRGRAIAAYSDVDSVIPFVNTKTRTLYGTITADITERTELTAGLAYQRTLDNGFSSGFPLFYHDGSMTDFGLSGSNNASWNLADNDTASAHIDATHRFDNRWNARLAYSRTQTDMQLKYIYWGGAVHRQTGLMTRAATIVNYEGDLSRDGLHATLSGPVTVFGREHELAFGWAGVKDALDLTQRDPVVQPAPASYFDRWRDPVAEPVWSSSAEPVDVMRTRQTGAYAVARLSLADPLHVIAGARVSDWKTDHDYFGTLRKYRYDNQITPYAGVIWDIDARHAAYASVTEIFKPQNNRDATGGLLPPVDGRSVEVGVKAAYLDGRANVSVALFQTRQNNLAEAIPGQTVNGQDNTQAYRPVAGAKVQGLDVEVAGALLPNWNITASYTNHIARNANGEPINTAFPRVMAKLFTTYRLTGTLERLTLGGGVRWQNASYRTVSGPVGRVRVGQGGYAVVDLMARYQFTSRVSATLNLNNALDKRYFQQIGLYNTAWYGQPRNLTLSLRMQY